MSTIELDWTMEVYFDYCPPEGECLVILRSLIGQYMCDVGYLRECKASDSCSGGYHIESIGGFGPCKNRFKRINDATHYDTKGAASQRLFELWQGKE